MLGKYDNSPECAWNSLRNSACVYLEQYEKGQVVFPRAVAIHTPLGEFHTAWSVRNLESTKIVLGNIWLNSAWRNLGSTIIYNQSNKRIMDRILKQDLSKNEIVDLLRGMDAEEVEGNFSVRRVLIDTQACDVFGGEPEDSYPLIPGTYMALYYKSIVDDPYPFFEKICGNIINDDDKCQMLMNGDGCIRIFMLNKYE